MELVVDEKYLIANLSVALDVTGREHLVIVAKATWSIPKPGQRPRPLKPQPFSLKDEFYGEPGESPYRYDDDFARFKPKCDVLFDACACSPSGEPVTSIGVGVQLGSLIKQLKVTGQRVWEKRAIGYSLSEPEPFIRMPLHYGFAFGGSLTYEKDGQELADTYEENPTGIGWAGPNTRRELDGKPAPCLERLDQPVEHPEGKYQPIALSAIGRNLEQRSVYAGTFDDTWREQVSPFLPEDFDDRYNQCAPLDQQIDYPQGGEEVRLVHLLEDQSDLRFKLPPLDKLKVRVLRKDYTTEEPEAHADTLLFETEQRRFSVVWRASTPIRRRIQEFDTIAVGAVDPAWWQAKSLGIGEGCSSCGGAS